MLPDGRKMNTVDPQLPVETWQTFRAQMPVTKNWAYFDHAAVAPLSLPTATALEKWSHQAVHHGDTQWPDWYAGAELTRQHAATMIGAHTDEIALVPNTTTGIHLVAEGFPWQAGDNLVTLSNEFPSNLYPWMNLQSRGVETRRVVVEHAAIDIDQILEVCDERTRIVSVSWVGYASGWRIDVNRLVEAVHNRGGLLFLDAIQGLGVFPLDVQQCGVDFLAADGHKWMLGPEGAGLFYIRKEHLNRLRPLGVGWHSVVHAFDFSHVDLNLRPTAARYEGGSQNMAGMLALGASLEFLTEMGVGTNASTVADRVLQVTDASVDRLRRLGAIIHSDRKNIKHNSGIVSFSIPGKDPTEIRQRCLEQKVVLSCRDGRLRISPHAYVNEEDVERLCRAVSDD